MVLDHLGLQVSQGRSQVDRVAVRVKQSLGFFWQFSQLFVHVLLDLEGVGFDGLGLWADNDLGQEDGVEVLQVGFSFSHHRVHVNADEFFWQAFISQGDDVREGVLGPLVVEAVSLLFTRQGNLFLGVGQLDLWLPFPVANLLSGQLEDPAQIR